MPLLAANRSWANRYRTQWRVVAAEALKQHRTLFGGRLVYFSMFVWPLLQLASAYYVFKPFLGTAGFAQRWALASAPHGLFLFVATGMLGYMFFWSLVQSAWMFASERTHGTLELVFLTPVNRLIFVVANSVGSLAQSTWLFLTFCSGLVALTGGLKVAHPGMLLIAFFGLLLPAVAWGAFLNSIFLFSRDASFLFTLLDEPMSFFTGVRVPVQRFPIWGRALGALFPLSSSLVVLRSTLLEGATLRDVWLRCLLLLIFSLGLFGATAWLLRRGETHARNTGSLTLF